MSLDRLILVSLILIYPLFTNPFKLMSFHIGAEKNDIAETVLLPGDPLRAKFIADNFLENAVCYNKVRNMLGFTGTYKGHRVSIQGAGMGIPSTAIYANELVNEYGVKTLIRIGTCGSLRKDIDLGEIILAISANTDSSINRLNMKGECLPEEILRYQFLSNLIDEDCP